ncbi:pyridoxal phosphate-dependent transferase [Aspergillus leporis]|uniref:Pyridoxal phosphate-dependent transferase n=1 Tax=Aspergillus leporis TaxID=41062 RepID=A0A5N5WYN6_9EURO|nr:pyridoxal phosphate-dependent transferase [Aspergillus leporis]
MKQARLRKSEGETNVPTRLNMASAVHEGVGKPKAKCWDREFHLTRESQSRPFCILKQAAGYLKDPDIVSLGGGLPSGENLPFYERTFSTIRIGKYDAQEGTSEYDLSTAFNYGQAAGSPQMVCFVTEHTELVYSPPYANWQVCQTVGSAPEQTIRMFCDQYSFSTLEALAPRGIKAFGVKMDSEDALLESMDEILSTWDEESRGARKPHVLYTVPSGLNPTGAAQSLNGIATYMQLARSMASTLSKMSRTILFKCPPYKPTKGKDATIISSPKGIESFLTGLIPSYLNLDVDGRVLRMGSFSKVLGYLKWLIDLKNNYTRRRDTLLAACHQFLPKAIVGWIPPAGGMFLWLRLDHSKHPECCHRSVEEIEEGNFQQAISDGVLCARSSCGMFLRTIFASASEEMIDMAIQRLGQAIRQPYRNE